MSPLPKEFSRPLPLLLQRERISVQKTRSQKDLSGSVQQCTQRAGWLPISQTTPNIEFVSFPANSRVVNAQRIHDNILCVLLLQPSKLWLFCRICLLVGPDPDFQVLILKYFLTPLKLLICTLYENCYPILLNFSNIVSCYFHLLAACFFFFNEISISCLCWAFQLCIVQRLPSCRCST